MDMVYLSLMSLISLSNVVHTTFQCTKIICTHIDNLFLCDECYDAIVSDSFLNFIFQFVANI